MTKDMKNKDAYMQLIHSTARLAKRAPTTSNDINKFQDRYTGPRIRMFWNLNPVDEVGSQAGRWDHRLFLSQFRKMAIYRRPCNETSNLKQALKLKTVLFIVTK